MSELEFENTFLWLYVGLLNYHVIGLPSWQNFYIHLPKLPSRLCLLDGFHASSCVLLPESVPSWILVPGGELVVEETGWSWQLSFSNTCFWEALRKPVRQANRDARQCSDCSPALSIFSSHFLPSPHGFGFLRTVVPHSGLLSLPTHALCLF